MPNAVPLLFNVNSCLTVLPSSALHQFALKKNKKTKKQKSFTITQLNRHAGACAHDGEDTSARLFLLSVQYCLCGLFKGAWLWADCLKMWLRRMQIQALLWQLTAWSAFIYIIHLISQYNVLQARFDFIKILREGRVQVQVCTDGTCRWIIMDTIHTRPNEKGVAFFFFLRSANIRSGANAAGLSPKQTTSNPVCISHTIYLRLYIL